MGTRAIILFNGKPLVATHWDGYPEGLGADLLKAKPKNPSQILRVAKKHNIDAGNLSQPAFRALQEKRFAYISKRTHGKYSVQDLKNLEKEGRQLTFGIMTPKEYPIGSLEDYDDFAEFEYNVTSDGKVTVRPLSGTWKQSRYSKVPFRPVKLKKKLGEVS